MFSKFFKDLRIRKKILFVTLGLLVLNQLTTLIIACFSIKSVGNISDKEMIKLSVQTSHIGESSIREQSEKHLQDLSFLAARSSNALFEEISNQVLSVCNSIEKVYKNKYNFKGKIPPLPGTYYNSGENEKTEAFSKGYVIDEMSSSECPLAYNIPEYKNVYKIDSQEWNSLTDSERKDISAEKCVVSKSSIPADIYNQLITVSGMDYILESIYKSNTCISNVYLGTESGILYKYSSDNSHEIYDPRERKWYTDALGSMHESPVWQSSYISKSTGKFCVTCSKSFTDENGKICGVCAIDMQLDDILEFVSEYKIGRNGYSLILDSEGKIVMHPQYKSFFENTDTEEIEELKKSGILEKITSEKNGISSCSINKEDYYATYSPLTTNNWIWVGMIKQNEIVEPISKIQSLIKNSAEESEKSLNEGYNNRFLLSIIMFAINSIIIYWICTKLSKNLSGPIIRLNMATKTIGEGNFNSKIAVENNDEIGELAESFNQMVVDLKTYMEELARTTAEKQKIHSELMIAKKIQRSMLPCIFPAFPNRKDFDIYAIMDPAKEVGGDFYDFFFINENTLALVIADVSGKGVSAALFMVIAKILIKNQLQNGDTPSEALKIVNNRLCQNNEAGMFVTCFIGLIDIHTGQFTYANAGHNPPILYKNSKRECIPISKPHGFVLGGMPNLKYTEEKTYLDPEDILFLYTDGVTEAENTEGKLFSQEKLEKVILDSTTKDLSLKELIQYLRAKIDEFSSGAERSDDITMLAFKNFDFIENPDKKQ